MKETPEIGRSTHFATAIFASQQTTTQRRPAEHAQPQRLAHGNQLSVWRAFDQAVLHLQPDDGCPTAKFGNGGGSGDAPSREIREPYIKVLAGPDQVIEP